MSKFDNQLSFRTPIDVMLIKSMYPAKILSMNSLFFSKKETKEFIKETNDNIILE